MATRLTIFVAIACWWMPSACWALVTGGVYVGQRTVDFSLSGDDQEEMTGTDISASLTIDPIPMVPIGVGVLVSLQNFKVDEQDHGVSEFVGTVIVPEIKGWLPMVPVVTPYARAGYAFGAYKPKINHVLPGNQAVAIDGLYETSGVVLGVGLEYSPLPLVAIGIEYNLTQQKITPTQLEYTDPTSGQSVDLAEVNGLKEEDFATQAVLLGVTVGI